MKLYVIPFYPFTTEAHGLTLDVELRRTTPFSAKLHFNSTHKSNFCSFVGNNLVFGNKTPNDPQLLRHS